MNIQLGETLARLRNLSKLSQKNAAEKLADYGFNLTNKTIYNWEKGLAKPGVEQFLALCDIYRVDDIWWEFAGEHRGPLTGLNEAGRKRAREFIDLLFHIDMFRDDPPEESEFDGTLRLLPLYDIAVSAGTGTFLDESGYEMIEVPAYVPQSAGFALRIRGDSMEPLYQDKQIIWVREQQVLDSGEIGVFYYDENAYCKKFSNTEDGIFLCSLNDAYDDIEIGSDGDFRIIGKVVA